MLSALNFLTHFKKEKKLKACPVFIGPNTDLVDVSVRLIEKHLSKSTEHLPAKDNATFWDELHIKYGQQSFFSTSPLTLLTGCTPKFLEKTTDYIKLFQSNFIFHAPKLPYKSPLISQLEKTGKFIFLTCFNPSAQELFTFAQHYLDLKDPKLKEIFPQLPQNLPALIDELDKITLIGLENYLPDLSPQDETVDTVFFNLLTKNKNAPGQLNQLLKDDKTDPNFLLKSLLFQLKKLKSFIVTPPHGRNSLKLNKLMTNRFEHLSKNWTAKNVTKVQMKLYETEFQMRLNHDITPLILERDLSEIFILSRTTL